MERQSDIIIIMARDQVEVGGQKLIDYLFLLLSIDKWRLSQ